MIIKEWDGHTLKGDTIAIDTETTIVPFTETPDLVTFQAYTGEKVLGDEIVYFVSKDKLEKFLQLNSHKCLIMHNAPFDIDVIEKASNFKFKELIYSQTIYDTMILWSLLNLARTGLTPHKSSLAHLTEIYLKKTLNKEDSIRKNFTQFLNVSLKDIPQEFKEYAAEDVISTYEIFHHLVEDIKTIDKSPNLLTHNIQLRGALALNRIYKNGIGFSQKKKKTLLNKLTREAKKHEEIINKWGYFRGVKGTQTRYEHICNIHKALYGIELPYTETGKLASDADSLEPYKQYEFFNALCEFKLIEKTLSFFEKLDEDRVHPQYQYIMNTGRTSCSKPNIQQLPRAPGVRELFIPAKGHVFFDIDYSQLELCTLAQTTLHLYGYSKMAELINQGVDLHKYYASVLLGKSIEEVTKEERQYAKAANFGFPGGLGIDKFIEYAEKSYGIKGLTRGVAEDMKKAWFTAFPELKQYMKDERGEAWTITGRLRADTTYCAEKNTPFQGLGADAAKLALYDLQEAGFKIVAFIHDEVLIEHPKSKTMDLDFKKACDIMVSSAKLVLPDINIKVEGEIKKEFSK